MVVCICNRLSEAMIGDAVAKGARTPSDVFRILHKRRGCSSCSVRVAETIDRLRGEPSLQAAE